MKIKLVIASCGDWGLNSDEPGFMICRDIMVHMVPDSKHKRIIYAVFTAEPVGSDSFTINPKMAGQEVPCLTDDWNHDLGCIVEYEGYIYRDAQRKLQDALSAGYGYLHFTTTKGKVLPRAGADPD